MRTAIIHDWLTGMRGGEKVLESMIDTFPDADIFTLLWVKGSVSPKIENQRITTSFLQEYPLIKTKYRNYLPLFPLAIEGFNLDGYDLIISSSHCAAKGIIPPPHARHICYCHTPMRYIWNMYFDYFGKEGQRLSALYRTVSHHLRIWDLSSNTRVDEFVANSDHVARRIKRYYGRQSIVIYPPVDTDFYHPVPERLMDEPYYLVVSALVPYKRIDLAIETFNKNGQKLVIIGEGPERGKLRKMAQKNIEFLGWETNEELRKWYSNCEALVFPGEEDFGIVPVETQACGRPVIAYARGGALETVVDRITGVLFPNQDQASLLEALRIHRGLSYNASTIVDNAGRFSRDRFCGNFKSQVDRLVLEQ